MKAFYSVSVAWRSCVLCLLVSTASIARCQNVIAWGDNSQGQATVPASATNVVAVAAGSYHSLALRADGTVVAWGNCLLPAAAASNVTDIAAGARHSVVLRSNGSVYCWGDNSYGQLNTPLAANTNVIAIAAGDYNTLALKRDGTVLAWGQGSGAQLPAFCSNVVAIAAGGSAMLVLRDDGLCYELSAKTRIFRAASHIAAIAAGAGNALALTPAGAVIPRSGSGPTGTQTFVKVACSLNYGLGLAADGTLEAWGSNVLTNVPAEATNLMAIAAGPSHCLAVRAEQAAPLLLGVAGYPRRAFIGASLPLLGRAAGTPPLSYQWLADGVPIAGADGPAPGVPARAGSDAVQYQLVVSNEFGAVTSAVFQVAVSPVQVWGNPLYGQSRVPALGSNVVAVAAGGQHCLALDDSGAVQAWGKNRDGQLNVPRAATNVVAIAAGGGHSLAVRSDGKVVAWGGSWQSQTNVPASLTDVIDVSAGWGHSLALKADGTVVGWGDDQCGQRPVLFSADAIAIASGYWHNMVLRSDGSVVTSGLDYSIPLSVSNVVAIAAGDEHCLALRADGTVIAWGDNQYGQCDVPSAATNVVALAAGTGYNVALRADGSFVSWGLDLYGTTAIPTGMKEVASIALGDGFNLALAGTGAPRLSRLPRAVSVPDGGQAVLACRVQGQLPLELQWLRNGVALPGATNRFLVISEAHAADRGTYTLRASNAVGQTVSLATELSLKAVAGPATGVAARRQEPFGRLHCVSQGKQATCAVAVGAFHGLTLDTDGTVHGWGENRDGQASVPASATNVVAIAAGNDHSLALKADGTVLAWGRNWDGQASVPAEATNIVAIDAGWAHSLALRSDGAVLAWGNDQFGQRDTAILAMDVIAIAAGYYHNMALRSDGCVVTWGSSYPLQGTNADLSVPAAATNIVAISAGWGHCLALRRDGLVVAWGDNAYGQCAVPSDLSNVVAIAAGYYFSTALSGDGKVWTWGRGSFGVTNLPAGVGYVTGLAAGEDYSAVLGGISAPRFGRQLTSTVAHAHGQTILNPALQGAYPMTFQWMHDGVAVDGATNRWLVLTNAQAADAGSYTLVASNAGGQTISPPIAVVVAPEPPGISIAGAWGDNAVGQCDIPRSVVSPRALAAGAFHCLALNADGSVVAWGKNRDGQTSVPASATNVVAVAAGSDHSLALKADGTVLAWGRNWDGQASVPAEATNVVAIAAGWAHSLALRANGTVAAWGNDELGQTDVPLVATEIIAIAAGYYHNMALRSDGRVVTWGLTYATRGGYEDYAVPAEATNVVAIAAGWRHCLALRADGRLVAWGDNSYGQSTIPTRATNVIGIAAGYYHSLALTADGKVIVWGKGACGVTNVPAGLCNVTTIAAGEDYSAVLVATDAPQFGRQPTSVVGRIGEQMVLSPLVQSALSASLQWYRDGVAIAGATNRWLVLAALQPADGGDYTLVASNAAGQATSDPIKVNIDAQPAAISLAGGWGDNSCGQCAVSHAVVNPRAIAAGSYHGLALNADGTVAAWGRNWDGQTNVPAAATNVIAIAAGGYHNLAVKEDGSVVGWGRNWDGQVTIPARATNIIAVAAGYTHSLALRVDGTLLAWGNNDYGQTNIHPLAVDVTAIAAGYYHSLALRRDGTVVGWGLLNNVPDTATNVVAIAGGWWHSVALRADGSVLAWGDNRYGQCEVPASATNIVAVVAGYSHSLALRDDGTVLAWGSNIKGVLELPAGLRNVAAIAAGEDFNLAIVEEGTPRFRAPLEPVAARTGGRAQLGAAFSGTQPLTCQWYHYGVPVPGATGRCLTLSNLQPDDAGAYTITVSNGNGLTTEETTFLSVEPSAGIETAPAFQNLPVGSAVTLSPAVAGEEPLSFKWQLNGVDLMDGANVSGTSSKDLCLSPAQYGDGGDYSMVISNVWGCSTSLVARVRVQQVVGWGDNADGQLWSPANATNLVALSSAGYHCLGLRADGSLVAWGDNDAGQNNVPQAQAPLKFVAISDADTHSLALRSDGRVFAWGAAGSPTNVPPSATNVVAISAGSMMDVALCLDGTLVMWGGQQVPVPAAATNPVALAAGSRAAYVVRADGQVVPWGSAAAVPAAATDVVALTAVGENALALKRDGSVLEWYRPQPLQASARQFSQRVLAVAKGPDHSLAVLEGGKVEAWGTNNSGQLSVPKTLTNVAMVAAGYAHSLALVNDGSATMIAPSLAYAVKPGSPVVLGFGAPGSVPLTCQWFHNGVALPEPHDPFLVLRNAQALDAGRYELVTTDVGGRTNRQSFSLAVLGPLQVQCGMLFGDSQSVYAPLQVTGLSASGEVILYVSTNLVNWEPIFTNPASYGPVNFIEALPGSPQQRFYRASEKR